MIVKLKSALIFCLLLLEMLAESLENMLSSCEVGLCLYRPGLQFVYQLYLLVCMYGRMCVHLHWIYYAQNLTATYVRTYVCNIVLYGLELVCYLYSTAVVDACHSKNSALYLLTIQFTRDPATHVCIVCPFAEFPNRM